MSHRIIVSSALLCALAGGSLAQTRSTNPDNRVTPQTEHSLTEVYRNSDFQLTGVTISKNGRMFVNFPRWSDRYVDAVMEIMPDGSARPYPNKQWNEWGGSVADAAKHFVCVQSVVVDDTDTLWVVDAAGPLLGPVVESGAKLVEIDLGSNEVKKTYSFDHEVIKPNSYLNDVRIDTSRHVAYMTDSGVGGIVVVDLQTGKAHRCLDGTPAVLGEPSVKLTIDDKILIGPDGKPPRMNSDGIALSPDGSYLYFQALTAKTLYRIATQALRDTSDGNVSSSVEKVVTSFRWTDCGWTSPGISI